MPNLLCTIWRSDSSSRFRFPRKTLECNSISVNSCNKNWENEKQAGKMEKPSEHSSGQGYRIEKKKARKSKTWNNSRLINFEMTRSLFDIFLLRKQTCWKFRVYVCMQFFNQNELFFSVHGVILTTGRQTFHENDSVDSRDGAVVKVLASYKCGPCSIPARCHMRLSLLLNYQL